MKKTCLVFILIFAATSTFSQLSFGLKGGLNFSKLPQNVSEGTAGQILTALDDVYTGYHFGGLMFLGFSGSFAQIELLYSQTGQDMVLQTQTANNFESRFRNIDLPVNLGIRFGPIKVGAGPVFSYLIKTDNNLSLDINFSQKLKELALGYQIVGGLKLGTLLIDLKYQGNLTGFGEQISIGNQTFDFDRRPHNFILSVGILL